MSDDNISKVANECADKLRGMEAVVPPPVPQKKLEPVNNFHFTFLKTDDRPWWDEPLSLIASVGLAAGFMALGFAIAAGVR